MNKYLGMLEQSSIDHYCCVCKYIRSSLLLPSLFPPQSYFIGEMYKLNGLNALKSPFTQIYTRFILSASLHGVQAHSH